MSEEKTVKNVKLNEVSGGGTSLKEIECPYFHFGPFFIDDDAACPTPKDRKYNCCNDCNRSY